MSQNKGPWLAGRCFIRYTGNKKALEEGALLQPYNFEIVMHT